MEALIWPGVDCSMQEYWLKKAESVELELRTHNAMSSRQAIPHPTDHAIRSLRNLMPRLYRALLET